MDYRGTFENGLIHPDQPVDLPNGTPVEFHPVARRNGQPAAPTRRSDAMDELERADSEARRGKSLDELAVEQGVAPFRSLDELRIAGLENEDVDAFIRSVKEGRR